MRVAAAALGLAIGSASAQVGPPYPSRHIYPAVESAQNDIKSALKHAKSTHKRIILDFGGDWCPDCQVLYIYFHQSPNAELIAKHFVVVPVNIGRMDRNLDVAHKYGVPVTGVPALAVLDADGNVVYAQQKEFSSMRSMDPKSVTDFLNKWKQ
jgi:thiol:disulfide interchange protein